MKRTNLTIVATIIATFVISTIAFQSTVTEASNNISPTATPSPRKKRPIAIQSPKPIQSSVTRKSNVRKSKTTNFSWGESQPTKSKQMRKQKKPSNFSEVSGIGMEVGIVKRNTKRKRKN
jgi:hypothetical protein